MPSSGIYSVLMSPFLWHLDICPLQRQLSQAVHCLGDQGSPLDLSVPSFPVDEGGLEPVLRQRITHRFLLRQGP